MSETSVIQRPWLLLGQRVPPGKTLDLSFMNPGTLDPRIAFTRASTATYFDSGGTMQTAATNAPRFDYDPATHVLRGLLIEEARTNLALQSQFAAIWTPGGATQTANAVTSPDGTITATTLTETAVSSVHNTLQSITKAASAITYAFSVFAKQGSGTRNVKIQLDDGGSNGVTALVNPSVGTVVADVTPFGAAPWSGTPVAYTQLPSGWGRYAFTATTGATTTFRIILSLANGVTGNYLGDGSSTIQLYGCQAEVGAFPTSYIPTTAAAVTRAVEAATMSTAGWYNAPAGTLYVRAYAPPAGASTAENNSFYGLDDGTAANDIELRSQFGVNDFRISSWVTNAAQGATSAAGTITAGALFKGAATYTVATPAATSLGFNGAVSAVNATTAFASGLTTLRIGSTLRASAGSNNAIQAIRYWPRALSNAELQQVTR